ncbi:MAG: dihydrofolate reductase family protein [Solirubrobacteraceae bacterium]|jgi:dihydrofolate reductase|nr:dihydrofolate reductase family protein [Solirubrobacteraceae bacterium]
MAGRVRIFLACSLDGFIAGPDGDLAWLPEPRAGEDLGFEAFLAASSALLMGRTTYDVVAGFDGPWPYGDTPVFVATTRPLDPVAPGVRAVRGTPAELLAAVQAAAPGDVYLDGGALVRAFLAAGLVDELTLTVIPVLLGAGVPLFAGASRRTSLRLVRERAYAGGLVQLTYAPA